MQIYNTVDFKMKETAVTLGKFDGVHIGHKRLISEILNGKETEGLRTVLFSFDTSKIKGQNSLTTTDERIELCKNKGIDDVIFFPVTKETMAIEPEKFIEEILVKKLDARMIVTGRDFCFGKNRSGNVEMLRAYADKYGYQLIVVDSVMMFGERVSSSKIKSCILEGDIEGANVRLGHRYFMQGEILSGKQIGRTIDTRTANIIPGENKICPPNGVYKTKILIDGVEYKSVTNVGTCPTLKDENKLTVETHIFDFDDNIYGKKVNIYFEKFIRYEKKFNNIDELKQQIALDILQANL